MYQIDVPSAAAARPAPTAMGAAGFFTDGDMAAGQAATIVPAEFLNMLMVEMLGILTGAGIAPSKAQSGQLAQAMPKITGRSVKFPSGLIVNFGGGAHSDSSGAQVVAFDTPFTGDYVGVACNHGSGPPVAAHGTGSYLPGQMTIYSAGFNGGPAGAGTAFWYIAIGR